MLRCQHRVFGMYGVGCCQEHRVNVIPLDDVLKALLLVTLILLCECFSLFRGPREAGHHFHVFAPHRRIGNDRRPTPKTDLSHPHYVSLTHRNYLLPWNEVIELT